MITKRIRYKNIEMFTRFFCFLILLQATSCSRISDKSPASRLEGKWLVDEISYADSSAVDHGALPAFGSVEAKDASLFYRARELKSIIELEPQHQLNTKLVFSNFGKPVWSTNAREDSLVLKLIQVTEESLIADGTVGADGELLLYEGAVEFIDSDKVQWKLSDGRVFVLKRQMTP